MIQRALPSWRQFSSEVYEVGGRLPRERLGTGRQQQMDKRFGQLKVFVAIFLLPIG